MRPTFADIAQRYPCMPVLSGSKRPAPPISTKIVELRGRTPTAAETTSWWPERGEYAIGIHCGALAGVVCIDFDDPETFAPWLEWLRDHDESLAGRVCQVKTPNGYHVWYRTSAPPATTKLARYSSPRQTAKGTTDDTRIEVRGVGAYALAPPSPGYEILSGDLLDLPEISDDEQGLLLSLARLFDEAEGISSSSPATGDGQRPGDWFNETADWDELVREAGGHTPLRRGRHTTYTRPGKRSGVSLSIGCGAGGDLARVFTSNWPPLKQRTYDKFGFFAELHHGGDVAAAARAISGQNEFPRTTRPSTSAPSLSVVDGGEPIRIKANNRYLNDVVDEALAALRCANEPPYVFVRDGALVRLARNEDGHQRIQRVCRHGLRYEMAGAAEWFRSTEKGEKPTTPPLDVVDAVLAFAAPPAGFPALRAVAEAPIVAQNGRIWHGPGYEPTTRTYVGDAGRIPEWKGTGKEAAQWLLENVLCDFRFDDEASRTNALAFMVTPIVAPYIDALLPIFLVDAPSPRSGKGLLVKAALLPALGYAPPAQAVSDRDEEFEKMLFTQVIEGAPVIFLDNVDRPLRSAALAALVTSGTFTGRVLGLSQSATARVRSLIALTMNNAKLSMDLAGRSVYMRIDAKVENPDLRTGFRHAKLERWILENRGQALSAVLGMAQAWLTAGRPDGSARKGSFETWAAVVGGILEICEQPGFLANDERLKASAAVDIEAWKTFYRAWWEEFQDSPVTAKQVRELAEDGECIDFVFAKASTDRGRQTAFGSALAKMLDRIIGGFTVQRFTPLHGAPRFKLSCEVNQVNSQTSYAREKPELLSDAQQTAFTYSWPQSGSPGSPLGSETGDPTSEVHPGPSDDEGWGPPR